MDYVREDEVFKAVEEVTGLWVETTPFLVDALVGYLMRRISRRTLYDEALLEGYDEARVDRWLWEIEEELEAR